MPTDTQKSIENRLLETKFHIPGAQIGEIKRPRLLKLLQNGLDRKHKLFLISAPAGYGKTTLLRAWLQSIQADYKIGWLSLDDEDNEINRFLDYWTSLFAHIDPNFGEGIQRFLGLLPQPPVSVMIDQVINQFVRYSQPVAIVIDDYHLIHNAEIHRIFEYFLRNIPEDVHLIISSRQDPPIPLAGLRAHGQMTEIRAENLRFTQEEMNHFFAYSMKLDLPEGFTQIIEERTEGWVAGLQLAGLALQNSPDAQTFVEDFRGSHRYVLDYLAEQVLNQQEEYVRDFLLQTSILDQFSAELCSALTGRNDAQSVIDQLEQSNLFVVALDAQRNWYRYHHLFAEYLRTFLKQDLKKELLEKASRWYKEKRLYIEAVKYAFTSGNFELSASIVEEAFQNPTTWSRGDLGILVNWLDRLPGSVIQSRPTLALHASRALYLAGRMELADRFLNQAEKAISETMLAHPDREGQLAIVLVYRASLAAFRGEVNAAFDLANRALDQLPQENLHARARCIDALGLAYELSGNLEEANRKFTQASQLAEKAGVSFLAINALCEAALVQINLGRLNQAIQTCQEAIALDAGANNPPVGLAWATLAYVALERNEIASAEDYLTEALRLSQQGGLIDDLRWEYLFLAGIKQAQGDLSGALTAIDQMDRITQSYKIERLSILAGAQKARLHLRQGLITTVEKWAEDYQKIREKSRVEYLRDFEEITLARVYLIRHEFSRAQNILQPLSDAAIASDKGRTFLETCILQVLCAQGRQDTTTAVEWLEKALKQAAIEGFAQIFIDEASASMQELFPRVRHLAPDFVEHLIQVGARQPHRERQPESLRRTEKQSVQLSDQEKRVLKLVASGKSNAEIATDLVISTGTAKWHVHNILQKLGVKNRAQAIILSKSMDL